MDRVQGQAAAVARVGGVIERAGQLVHDERADPHRIGRRSRAARAITRPT